MAVSLTLCRKFYVSTFNKELDVDSDTWKVSLHTSGWTPAQDTDQYHSTPSNELAASGNYSTGGATISPLSVGVATTKQANITGSNAAWTALTMSAAARYASIYDSTPGTEATRPLLGWVDFGADQTVAGANFTISWAAGGIAVFSVA